MLSKLLFFIVSSSSTQFIDQTFLLQILWLDQNIFLSRRCCQSFKKSESYCRTIFLLLRFAFCCPSSSAFCNLPRFGVTQHSHSIRQPKKIKMSILDFRYARVFVCLCVCLCVCECECVRVCMCIPVCVLVQCKVAWIKPEVNTAIKC